MKQAFRVVILIVVLAGSVTAASAQMGVPNPTTLSPPQSTNTPFGNQPHPFNNSHPGEPWDRFKTTSPFGVVLQVIDVPVQVAEVPMEVPQPGSLPNTIERVAIYLPGYRVVETTVGFFVQPHWGVSPGANGVYYWTWIPVQFRPR
jgi:hypothetical protein